MLYTDHYIGWEDGTAWDLVHNLRIFFMPLGLASKDSSHVEFVFTFLRFVFEYRIHYDKN